ncbi:MAG TPA: cellulase family glycosylhydrolase [Pseudolabrys sp.]|nr:cellulase family glycosylhydrolase [Pseudolabrys sp.]
MSDASVPGGAAGSPDWLLGVNLAGAEFASQKNPGTYGVDYIYPSHSEIDYYANAGMSVIRLPFLWERLQTSAFAPLDASQLAHIDDVVNYANAKGLKVILDAHDYGSYQGSLIGSAAVPNAAFADMWGKLAGHFAADTNVMFDLMNEPHAQTAAQWLDSTNAAIAEIREAGATSQEILVSGTYSDGAWRWVKTDNAAVIGTGVQDPSHNFAFDVHQYLDSNGSGTHATVVSTSIGVERLEAITNWAEATGNHLFLGEFGVSTDQTSVAALDNMLSYMQTHSDAWQGATYWAGGPWWGNYMYSIEPSNGADKPQMDVLQNHLSPLAQSAAWSGPGLTMVEKLVHDTGASNADFITNDGHVTLLGTSVGSGLSHIEIFDAGKDIGAATLVHDAWTFSTVLGEGNHDLSAVATDLGGNSIEMLAPDMIIVDQTRAAPIMSNAVFNAATGLTTFSGTSAAGDTVSIYDKGPQLIGTATAGSDGTWKLNADVGSDSIHSYIARSIDVAGNTANSAGHTLYSPDAHQALIGGAGNDVLIAGANDGLRGGAGADTFVFNSGFGNAAVKDFDVNSDALAFNHNLIASAAQLLDQAHDTAAGAVIDVAGGQSVTLANVHLADLQAHTSDFHFI